MPRRRPRKLPPHPTHDALDSLARVMPRTPDELHRFVTKVLRLRIPRQAMIDGHDAPFAYLVHAFFEGHGHAVATTPEAGAKALGVTEKEGGGGDCVVWANRGGGKTKLGAAATVLDLLFKPGVQVRILAGTLEQAGRMYRYLLEMFEHPWLRPMLDGAPTQRRVALRHGSAAEVLAQSQCSVRGTHVHKLRCDEVEEFDPAVWDAAQLVTRSQQCGDWWVRGTVEALSTMHRVGGLMSRLVAPPPEDARAQHHDDPASSNTATTAPASRVFRWSVLDVMARCPRAIPCTGCVLETDCQGRAKEAHGFVAVADVWAQRHRVSHGVWAAEMLCEKPSASASVYPQFRIEAHVAPTQGSAQGTFLAGGMDFGIRSPLVFLWARVHPSSGARPADWLVEILDEYVEEGLTMEQNLQHLAARGWPRPQWIGVDPAGGQRNEQTGVSNIQELQRHGYKVRARRGPVADGIERLRCRLEQRTLHIDPCCRQLIRSLATYHFDVHRPQNPDPVKDGPDHACDALRYLIINLENPAVSGAVKVVGY